MQPQIVIVTSGGDWADASFDVLQVPAGRSLQKDREAYPGYGKTKLFFADWLVTLGYRYPGNVTEIESP